MEKQHTHQDYLPRNIYCRLCKIRYITTAETKQGGILYTCQQCKIDKPKRIVLENYNENKVLDRGSAI